MRGRWAGKSTVSLLPSPAPSPLCTTDTRVAGDGRGTPLAYAQPLHRPASACSQCTAAEPIRSSSSPLRAKEDRPRAAGAPLEVAAVRGRRAHGHNHSAGLELIGLRSRVLPGALLPILSAGKGAGGTVEPAWGTASTPLAAPSSYRCWRRAIAHVSRQGCKGHAKELRAWPRTVRHRHRPNS